MRRSVTMRSVIANQFSQMRKSFEHLLAKSPEANKTWADIVKTEIDSFGESAVLNAAEAPPADPVKFAESLSNKSDAQVEDQIRKYLIREISYLQIDTPTDRIVEGLIAGLKSDHPIDAIPSLVVADIPEMGAPEFHASILEEILRESVGLDGRCPDQRYSPDVSASNAFFLRMKIGAEAPPIYVGIRSGIEAADQETISWDDAAQVLADIAQNGQEFESFGAHRSETFCVAISHIAEEVAERIAMVTGEPMPPELRGALSLAINRIAERSGPQLEFTTSPEM